MINYLELPWLFSIIGASLGVVFMIVVSLLVKSTRKKIPVYDVNGYVSALGSINNIVEVSIRGSRLYIVLENPQFADVPALKTLGVASIITMARKIVLLIGDEAATIGYLIQERIKDRS
jgi:phosphotransferase system IIB component